MDRLQLTYPYLLPHESVIIELSALEVSGVNACMSDLSICIIRMVNATYGEIWQLFFQVFSHMFHEYIMHDDLLKIIVLYQIEIAKYYTIQL